MLQFEKPNLDLNVLANFRPVSNLPFISKILDKTMLQLLQSLLDKNKVFKLFQSGFKKYNSTETALLKVLNDGLIAGDSGDSNHSFKYKKIKTVNGNNQNKTLK